MPTQTQLGAGALAPQAAADLRARFDEVRARTEALCAPLEPEDCVLQSMPDASPARWHLAHTTWFFETFVLPREVEGQRPYDASWDALFNSYYETIGRPFPRPRRGMLSRPTVKEILAYRRHVDGVMREVLSELDASSPTAAVVELGLNHEEQHQELILTDVKHALSHNPLHPVYLERAPEEAPAPTEMGWVELEEGLQWIGHEGEGFCFDNERPRHRSFLHACAIGTRLVTSGEYKRFMADDGYSRPELWMAEGIGAAEARGWRSPLYWEERDGSWFQFTLSGLRPVVDSEPVCHLSYFEADAYARWAGARLPTEAEWEVAAKTTELEGNLLEDGAFHPRPSRAGEGPGTPTQLFGDTWEWTSSSYAAYPGYRPPAGALGEYNGKFMCNQYVLRGGSCATPRRHLRRTYRNFFPTDARWQFTGIRLAKDL